MNIITVLRQFISFNNINIPAAMSFLHLEHQGYFYGVARNNRIEYELGHTTSTQRIWEFGNVVNDYNNNCTRIVLPEEIHLNQYTPNVREDLNAVNNLALLGPLNAWIQLNTADYVNSINANVLSNRGILKKICLKDGRGYSFLVKLDEAERYNFHDEPYTSLPEENLTGFAFENFILHGNHAGYSRNKKGANEREYDYREKHYSVQSLTLRHWKILYNAEYDGFLNFPLWPLTNGRGVVGRDYNIVRAAPLEMKLFSNVKGQIPDWTIQNWFIQCQLGNIDNLIIGLNPNGRKADPRLSEIRLYKVQDLPTLQRNAGWSPNPSQMMGNLERILLYLDEKVRALLTGGETFRIRVQGNGQISHELYRVNLVA